MLTDSLRPVRWKHRDQLINLPWPVKAQGAIFLVGVGDDGMTALFAAMALGMLVTAILLDLSEPLKEVVDKCLPNVCHRPPPMFRFGGRATSTRSRDVAKPAFSKRTLGNTPFT